MPVVSQHTMSDYQSFKSLAGKHSAANSTGAGSSQSNPSALGDFVNRNMSNWRSNSESGSSLDLSDLVVERTIDMRPLMTPAKQMSAATPFMPSEMTGRSTEIETKSRDDTAERQSNIAAAARLSSFASSYSLGAGEFEFATGERTRQQQQQQRQPMDQTLLSTEQILSQSVSLDVRNMTDAIANLRLRQSIAIGTNSPEASFTSLPRTADMSCDSRMTSSSMSSMFRTESLEQGGPDDFRAMQAEQDGHFVSDEMEFRSGRLTEFMDKVQKEWAEEFGLPERSTNSTVHTSATYDVDEPRDRRKLDETDFSSTRTAPSNQSLGTLFSARSDNLREILPHGSPIKVSTAIRPMIATAQSTATPPIARPGYLKYAQVLETNSPKSWLDRILNAHNSTQVSSDSDNTLPANNATASPPDEPTASDDGDVLFVTEAMPMPTPIKTTNNVHISKCERVIGDANRILQALTNHQTATASNRFGATALTPSRQHIVSKLVVKNDNILSAAPSVDGNKENIATDASLSETVSYSESMFESTSNDIAGVRPSSLAAVDATGDAATLSDRNPVDNIHPTVQTKRRRSDVSQFSTPPSNREVPHVANVHALQSRSRLVRMARHEESDESDDCDKTPPPHPPPSSHSTPTQSNRTLTPGATSGGAPIRAVAPTEADTSDRSSPGGSSTFTSPRFCSSKSEAMYGASKTSSTAFSQYGGSSVDLVNAGAGSSVAAAAALAAESMSALKSSRSVLSWGSTKLRKSTAQRLTIKNVGSRRLSLRTHIVGPGFQIAGGSLAAASQMSLQSQECRTITVQFCPTVIGPAIGQLSFFQMDDSPAGRSVSLYGYGGNTVMQVLGITRGPVGVPFLTLGEYRDVSHRQTRQTFSIYNRGPLRGMVLIRVKPTSRSSSKEAANIRITPSKCVLDADSQQQIELVYTPRKSELSKLFRRNAGGGSVLTVASLEIMYGDNANRLRIARQLPKLRASSNAREYAALDILATGFGGSGGGNVNASGVLDDADIEDGGLRTSSNALEFFDENADVVHELFAHIRCEEVALTVERMDLLNETVASEPDLVSSLEESMMFCTLKPVLAVESTLTRMGSQMTLSSVHMPDAVRGATSSTSSAGGFAGNGGEREACSASRSWSVFPMRLTLNAFDAGTNYKHLTIASHSRLEQRFELAANIPSTLDVCPAAGTIRPGERVQIAVKLLKGSMRTENLVLVVFFKNDRQEVPIDVLNRSDLGR